METAELEFESTAAELVAVAVEERDETELAGDETPVLLLLKAGVLGFVIGPGNGFPVT